MLKIVSKESPLEPTYIPAPLICDSITKVWVLRQVYNQFYLMNKALQAEELTSLVLVSGYRSYAYQKMLYDRKVNLLLTRGMDKEEAFSRASTIVAPPGCSEHQLGLAIDVTSSTLAREEDPLIEGFEFTDQGKWLKENAKMYGFILRYPKDKIDLTGISYEPWHYRYVGVNHAKKMSKQNLCMEEYVEVYEGLRTE